MAEYRFTYNGEETWHAIKEHVFPYPYFRADAPVEHRNEPYTNAPYTGRNYRLFGFLADVRNGRGFAGVDLGDRIEPILGFEHPTRGVPKNASKPWKKYVKKWGVDLHSKSWLTLRELKAANWDAPIVQRGVLDAHHYEEIRATNFEKLPESWSGDVGGGGVVVLTPEQYEMTREHKGWTGPESHLSEDRWQPGVEHYYVRYEWRDTMRNYAGDFLEKTIPALEANAPRIGDLADRELWRDVYSGRVADPRPIDEDGIRMVFGFDN